MGQEISQQSKLCENNNNNINTNNNNHFNRRRSQNLGNQNCNEKYTKHKHPDPIYAPTSNCSTSSASSTTDDERYRQRQKYNLHKQAFEKTKVAKKFSLQSNSSATSNTTATSTSTSNTTNNSEKNFKNNKDNSSDYENIGSNSTNQFYKAHRHHRKSQSTDSGNYYSSCYCSSSGASSVSLLSSCGTSTTSGCGTSVASSKSHKSLDKQKQYLNHHLYIKSYLDILEEDEKARANFKPARPGGIRNYTPKILAETPITVSKPVSAAAAKVRTAPPLVTVNSKEDQWI